MQRGTPPLLTQGPAPHTRRTRESAAWVHSVHGGGGAPLSRLEPKRTSATNARHRGRNTALDAHHIIQRLCGTPPHHDFLANQPSPPRYSPLVAHQPLDISAAARRRPTALATGSPSAGHHPTTTRLVIQRSSVFRYVSQEQRPVPKREGTVHNTFSSHGVKPKLPEPPLGSSTFRKEGIKLERRRKERKKRKRRDEEKERTNTPQRYVFVGASPHHSLPPEPVNSSSTKRARGEGTTY
ncbi:hypothetical protein B0H12DRAFT_1068881 [Mycena haematopus]|nr:hypothetical protein B0H12DRAFT_1068881 [Mycena haematopus]